MITITEHARSVPFDNTTNGFPTAATNVQTAIESILNFDPIFNPVSLFDDFDNRMAWSPSTSGTGAAASVSGGNATFASGKHNGVARIATGTVLGTAAALVWSGNLAISLVLGNGQADYRALVKIPTLPTVANNFIVRVGLGTSVSVDHADGIYFEHSASSANWVLKTASNSVRTSTTSSIAATTNWVELRWVCNSAGTSVEYFIDDVSAGTITTNIPTVTGRGCGGNFQISNPANVLAAASEMVIDYFYYNKVYTARD